MKEVLPRILVEEVADPGEITEEVEYPGKLVQETSHSDKMVQEVASSAELVEEADGDMMICDGNPDVSTLSVPSYDKVTAQL